MPQATTTPSISVLMPVYNAQAFILQSVQSVLAQTCEDFDLIVVNDGSTDATRAILASIDDPRLRVIDNPSNLGVVASRNRAIAASRGRYIAIHDSNDLSVPTRFSRQMAKLDASPSLIAVCARQSVLEKGRVRSLRPQASADPIVLRALMHFGNPIGHSSVMFRADAIRLLGSYQREEFAHAADFDFLHRLLTIGEISELPDNLGMYRRHPTHLSQLAHPSMVEQSTLVFQDAYARLLGTPCADEAALMATHMLLLTPFTDASQASRTGALLDRLLVALCERHGLTAEQRDRVATHVGQHWWMVLQATLRAGRIGDALRCRNGFSGARRAWPPLGGIVGSALAGFAVRKLQSARPAARLTPSQHPHFDFNGTTFVPMPPDGEDPPVLYVVVDTEAEFDWSKAFDRSLTAVSAMRQQDTVQHLFDSWGMRPVYVVDYAVASQPEGFGPLRLIQDRHACVIGAHMHAWITPPFEETVSEYNSFGGNLPRDLEERKLRALIAAIEQNFGITPLFFRAGRYGVGPNTMDLLAKLGFLVDFSLLPHADLRARGGPDFRFAECVPYSTAGGRLRSVPMTRGQIGAIAPMSPRFQGLLQHRMASRLRLQGILSRLRLANTVTLTPEGVSTSEQIQLIETMLHRGCRSFVLHYHSPTLAKQTPYVRTEAELADFIGRIDAVCRYFFDVRGGLPGNPADLLPPGQRSRVWPAQAASCVTEPAVQ